MSNQFVVIDPLERIDLLKSLASEVRVRILELLHREGPRNVNEVAEKLGLPQSTISANIQVLVDVGLITTKSQKARKGSQKICYTTFSELLIAFNDRDRAQHKGAIEVAMPLGLYTRCEVTAPCGLCSKDGVIGLLDVPDTFLEPDRMRAGLLWFTRGFVEYQFPNNATLAKAKVEALELQLELSSEVPGTSKNWPSDITVAINGQDIDTWTAPADYGDKRGKFTPDWWKLAGSQYGDLTTWRVTPEGTFRGGRKVSNCALSNLGLDEHRSIRVRIGVKADARHPGGVNIFGSGFGNHSKDIVMRLLTE
ncbi:helix-turn-helix domain-containing protein [Mesorhizobium microcysteis]|jgi:predicted transcriptional regulator|uniref:Helix-turn-helix domain-containing protein n=1 Tax=Neoaquamicrobium microcysteis TaxID=2682781 RepID=A0A5D4GVK2_9HYPH|nr:helix-turn-helix domain-containing protein [Mesorhizobium microcysteis]TYR32746.1 helix-turn-helix domain-containing protein [Mesorhizobium microcysteis]